MKKARVWLDARGLAYAFHDYKKAGADAEKLAGWIATAGLDTVLNRAGTTFKKLPEEARADLDAGKAIALMVAQPSMIKRPIVEFDAKGESRLLVGFKEAEWAATLA